jgi:ribosomal protein L21
MFVSTKKALQDKAAVKTSDNSDSDSDKTTDMSDINKLKINAEAFIEVYSVITCSQAKSTTINTAAANVKSSSDKVASRNFDEPKTLKFIIKNSKKEKNFMLKRKGKRQAHTQEDNLEQRQLLYNKIFA